MTSSVSTRKQSVWWVATVCGMASYIDSAAIVGFGIAVVIYQAVLGLSPADVGLILGVLTFGIGVGALIGGRLGDRFGRRPVFTVTMILIIVGSTILVFGESAPVLIVATGLVGLGTGADLPVSLSTVSEAATDRNRGKMLGLTQQLWFAGILAAALLATLFGNLGRLGGQILYAHVAVMALLTLIARLSIPESESWKAARDERRSGVPTVRAERANLSVLLSGKYLVPFLGLIGFYALINLVANNNGQFSGYLLVNVAGQSPSFAGLVGLIALPAGLIFGGWFMAIVDGKHRFKYFIVGAVLTILSPLVIVVFGFSLPTYIISLVLSLPAGAFAGEAIMKFWTQESFPTLVRTTAQGTIIAVARFFAAGLATVTPLLLTSGAGVLYGLLTAVSAAGVLIAFLVFRTRDGRSEFDVEAEKVQSREDSTVG